jgi:ribosomal protein S18 acetylase RimI-like enzyme
MLAPDERLARDDRPGPVHLRRADLDDARGIADVQVRACRRAHRGIVPQAVLDHMSVEAREGFWREEMAETAPDMRPWVAEANGRTVGFVSSGISRDLDAEPGTGEVYAIFVEPEYWRLGIGRHLIEHACRDLRRRGFLFATLWVPEDSLPVQWFYQAMGWEPDGSTRTENLGTAEIRELRFRRELPPVI